MKHYLPPPTAVRAARRDDVDDLVALLREAIPDCLPETVAALPTTWPHYLVVEAPDGLVAAGSLQDVDVGRVEIRGLTVASSHRGRGLATLIVDALTARAESRGAEVVCVTRKPAFFRRLGFEDTPPSWLTGDRRLAPPARRVALARPPLLKEAR